MVTVADGLARPHNAFGAVRLALALLVVVSHAFSVTTGALLDEPLAHLTGYTLGEHAVNGFFAVSGFLVTMSLMRRGPRDYVVARALRIVPGLVAATLVVALGLGSLMTTSSLPAYWSDPGLWRFIQGTLTTFKSNAALPGVFSDNPFRFPMGTVWTLKYEVLCYLGLLAAGLFGALRQRWLAPLLVAGLFVALSLAGLRAGEMPKGLETSLRLPLIFAAGAALFLHADRARLSWPLAFALLALAALLHGTALYPPALFLAEAYASSASASGPPAAPGPRSAGRPLLRHLSLRLADPAEPARAVSRGLGLVAAAALAPPHPRGGGPVLALRRAAGARLEGEADRAAGGRGLTRAEAPPSAALPKI